MSKKILDMKWFLNESTLISSSSILSTNHLIDKLINKIVNDKTTFLNNLTFVIFNFRININRHQITIFINFKILFFKTMFINVIKIFNIRYQTCQRLRFSSFLFCRLSNNLCNWFSKTRSISNEKIKIKIKNQTQTKKDSIIVTKSKHLLSTNLKKKKICEKFSQWKHEKSKSLLCDEREFELLRVKKSWRNRR